MRCLVSLSRSAVWTRRAVSPWVCTPLVYRLVGGSALRGRRARSTRVGLGADRRPWPRPMQPHPLTRPHLGDLVDIVIDHHADDRVAAGDRMVGPQDYR